MPNNPRSLKARELAALRSLNMPDDQARYFRKICHLRKVDIFQHVEAVRQSGLIERYEGLPQSTKAQINQVIKAQINAGPDAFDFYSDILHDLNFPEDAAAKSGAN